MEGWHEAAMIENISRYDFYAVWLVIKAALHIAVWKVEFSAALSVQSEADRGYIVSTSR